MRCAAYNLYFLFLLPEVRKTYLLYLDFLVFLVFLFCFGVDFYRDRKWRRQKGKLLRQNCVIWQEMQADMENGIANSGMVGKGTVDKDIVEHDIAVLDERLQEQFAMNCALQDYFAKWCHEVKIPLAASLLMAEKIETPSLQESMREQLERINQQLRSALLGAKIQSSLFDLQIRETSLMECVRNSIHNNQFFLIRKHFILKIQNSLEKRVYTDPSWLTYVLDQLISNAIKYVGTVPQAENAAEEQEESCLAIYAEEQNGSVRLSVEDNGEGIKACDIRRIFEKGYTGSSYHNGKYQSTGMGLYMSAVILERLGHEIHVESEYGVGTRFVITFYSDKNVRFPGDL